MTNGSSPFVARDINYESSAPCKVRTRYQARGNFFTTMKIDSLIVNVELACTVGLEGAILLQHFRYWTNINASDDSMFRDGRVWVFASRKSITNVFPFLSEQKIRTTVDKLIEGGYLMKGEYNLSLTNKANWYALTDASKEMFDGGSSSLVKTTNGLVNPTNDINTKKENILSIEEKRRILAEKCERFVPQYGRAMIDAFVSYWGEANGNNLRCDIAKRKSGAFEISRRLATWASKDYNQPSKPVTHVTPQIPKPTTKPIWETLGMTKEQYDEMHK